MMLDTTSIYWNAANLSCYRKPFEIMTMRPILQKVDSFGPHPAQLAVFSQPIVDFKVMEAKINPFPKMKQ